MKILKSRHGLLRFFIFLFITLSFCSVIFVPNIIIYSGFAGWLFLFMCLLLFCIPPKTPDDIYKKSLKKPFLIMSLFQWSLMGIYYGLTELAGHWLTLYTPPQTNLFQTTSFTLWACYGFFPWPIITLFTLIFTRHIKHHDTYPHFLLKPLLGSEVDSASGLLFNTLTRGAFTILISLIIVIASLALAYLIAPHTLLNSLGFHPVVLFCFVGLFAFTVSKQAQHYWRVIATHTAINPFVILISLTLILATAIFISLGVSNFLHTPNTKSITIIDYLLKTGWMRYWKITSLCFWIMAVMPLALWFGELFKTAHRQKIILLTLTWPTLWLLLSLLYQYASWPLVLPEWINILLLLLSVTVFFILISEKTRWQTALRGYAPYHVEKNRPATRLLRNIAMAAIILLYLYWQSGVIGLSLLFVAIAMPIALLSLLALINLLAR